MLGIRIICVGKMKETHYVSAFAEYEKRLRPYCKLEVMELSEEKLPSRPSEAEIEAALKKEAADIWNSVSSGAYTIAMCIEGELPSSADFAALLSNCAGRGFSRICFIIGSSNGLHETVKSRADCRVSMSKMTFPHHLARVMLAEQIYRGIMINEGSKYHK